MAVNSIVQVNVSINIAPTPPTLQKTGAIVSIGGTILGSGQSGLLTQLSDLTPLLSSPAAISAATWSGGTVTITTTVPHGITVGESLYLTIAGIVGLTNPTGYNGNWYCLITGASAFTFVQPINPGTATVTAGTWVTESSVALLKKATTFFSQGSGQACFVLELGVSDDNTAITNLTNYLTVNPNTAYVPGATGYFYSYLVPASWDNNPNYSTLLQSFENPTARTYFFTTTTLATYTSYTDLEKCVFAMIQSPAWGVWAQNTITALSFAALTTVSPTSAGQATATTTSAHGVSVGQWFQIVGCLPVGYNGWWQAAPGTTASTLVWNVPAALGSETGLGHLVANQIANTGAKEFSCAAPWYVTLNYAPSSAQKVTPLEYSFIFGVTTFPTRFFNALQTTLKQNTTNIVGTGAEGGISNTITLWGMTKDGNDFSYWYSVDWVQINLDENTANAVINGNNDPINPLYYNQPGIDRLQAVAAGTMNTGITYGLVQGQVTQTGLDGPDLINQLDLGTFTDLTVVNAVPFVQYSLENPGDYKIGNYAGYTVIYMPLRGFDHIVYQVLVTELIAQ